MLVIILYRFCILFSKGVNKIRSARFHRYIMLETVKDFKRIFTMLDETNPKYLSYLMEVDLKGG